MTLEFKPQRNGGFDMTFQDDGRGIDPAVVRQVALQKNLITDGEAATLRNRQALKLVFKAGFTTLTQMPGGPRHGSGLAFVRRYVHDAGATIAIGSQVNSSTRFKVRFPQVADAAAKAVVA
jgi:two-component system chemotaxis sensor kinase CheA